MPERFPDSRRRLERAIVHLEALGKEWLRVANPDAHKVELELSSDWTFGVAKSTPKSKQTNDMALELGEFFYQLRSCLDALIYQAAIYAEGVDPPSKADSWEFPICVAKTKFDNYVINKPPFPRALRDWLEELQPYNIVATNCGLRSHLARYIRPLQIIHDCARKDRHRRLHVVAAVPDSIRFQFSVTPGVTVSEQVPLLCNFLEDDESYFLRFKVSGITSHAGAGIRLATKIMVAMSLDEIPLSDGTHFGEELNILVATVKYIIDFFEAGYQ